MSVRANNMDAASQASGHKLIYAVPSVCITPAAPSPLPIPYPIMTPQGTKESEDDASKVKLMGKPAFCVGSEISSCKGNEAGTQKEVVSLKTSSKGFVIMGSPNVKMMGSSVAFNGSPIMGNKT